MSVNVLHDILTYVTETDLPLSIADPAMDDCPLIAVSEGFCAMTEYDRSQLLGKNCRLLQCAETTREQRVAFRFSLKLNEAGEHRITNRTAAGRVFDNLVTLFPFFEPQSERTLFCASQYDISKPLSMLAEFSAGATDDPAAGGDALDNLRRGNALAIIQSRRQMASLVQRKIAAKLATLAPIRTN